MICFEGDFAGNESAARSVRETLKSGRFPRLIIIDGVAGSGRKTLAGIIARAAVCSGERPYCGVCSNCRKFLTGHPDVYYIEPDASKKHTLIGVDDIRSAINDAYVCPNEAARKVYVVNDADKLTVQAQNALLKIVEDGPSHILFVFVCLSRFALLETVISRALTLTLSPVSDEEAAEYLCAKMPTVDRKEIVRAVELSAGVIGKAIQILDGEDDEAYSVAVSAADYVAKGSEVRFLCLLTNNSSDRKQLCAILGFLCEFFRDAVCIKSGAKNLLHPARRQEIGALSHGMTMQKLIFCEEMTAQAKDRVLKNISASLIIPLLSSQLF